MINHYVLFNHCWLPFCATKSWFIVTLFYSVLLCMIMCYAFMVDHDSVLLVHDLSWFCAIHLWLAVTLRYSTMVYQYSVMFNDGWSWFYATHNSWSWLYTTFMIHHDSVLLFMKNKDLTQPPKGMPIIECQWE